MIWAAAGPQLHRRQDLWVRWTLVRFSSAGAVTGARSVLDIEVRHVEGVVFDEAAARLDDVAH